MIEANKRIVARLRANASELLDLADILEGTKRAVRKSEADLKYEVRSTVGFEAKSPALAWAAELIYSTRTSRNQSFHLDIFGEPAWDLLLDLFIHDSKGIRISVTSCCLASNVPPTTALRWIDLLEREGLIRRADSKADKRRSWVSLTDQGYQKTSEALNNFLEKCSPATRTQRPKSSKNTNLDWKL